MPETSASPVRFDPLSPDQRRDPYPVYAEARAKAPVFFAEPYGFWVVTRYDDVLAVLKDDKTYSSVNALRSSTVELPPEVEAVLAEGWPEMPVIVDTDPPLHTRIRGLINAAFTPRRIAGMEPTIAAVVDELLDGIAPAGHADVVEQFAWPLPLRVMGRMLGLPRDDLERLHHWSNDWLALHQPGGSLEQQSTGHGTPLRCSGTSWTPCSNRRREVATSSLPRSSPLPQIIAVAGCRHGRPVRTSSSRP
jgi:cytochrome P450